jgi:hypothetical protein
LTTTIPSYGVIICEVDNTRDFDTKQLGLMYDGTTHTCTDIVADSTDCDYHQHDDGVFPSITSTVVSDENTLVVTGENFEF